MLHFNNSSIEPSSVPLQIPAPAAGKHKKKTSLLRYSPTAAATIRRGRYGDPAARISSP